MEPFIQLTYSEQCPQKTSQLKETTFVDRRKVPESFWFDLLDRKCPEGLGEVSESLVKDESLTAADFYDDQDELPGHCSSDLDCLTSSKLAECNEFKTPLTSRYKHRTAETPSLFSQDESINPTPTSSFKSQLTCHEDTTYKPADTSPNTPQIASTPVALCRYSSGRRTKTPDLLAKIMGHRASNLSCLLAGGSDDDATEWSESMATPPLKMTEPAGDETDGEKGHLEETEEEGGQPQAKRIARTLFARSATNQSMEPVELSEGKDSILGTVRTVDTSCIAEEFLLEYSCHDESEYDDKKFSEILFKEPLRPSPPQNKADRSEADEDENVIPSSPVNASRAQFSPNSPKPNLFQSPFPKNVFSPTAQTPFQVLAQSTPKPENPEKFRLTSLTGFKTGLNGDSVTEDFDTSVTRDSNALSDLPSILRDKEQDQVSDGVTCHATEMDGTLEVSDVTFGSPSRSFELAMAREADKLCSGVERDSRTSGLGSSLSVSPNAQSPHAAEILNKTTNFQLTEALQQVTETPRNNIKAEKEITENTNENPGEPAARSGADHGNLVRRRSFCKVPGLRRSVRAKRFSYPTASQVTNKDTSKRVRETATSVNALQDVKKEKSPSEEEKPFIERSAAFHDTTTFESNKGKRAEDEKPVSKRFKSEDTRTFSESEKDVGSLFPAADHIEKDNDLFDMDTLSQFPVECICSPPHLNRASDSSPGYTGVDRLHEQEIPFLEEYDEFSRTSQAKHGHLLEKDFPETEEKANDLGINVDEQSNVPFTSADIVSAFVGFQTANGKHVSISSEALAKAKATLKEIDNSLGLHERPNGQTEEPKGCLKEVDVGEPTSTLCKSTTDRAERGNLARLEKQQSSVVSEFCGFSTASGKRVHISESAMKQARKTLNEIDAELNGCGSGSQALKVADEKEQPSYNAKTEHRTLEEGKESVSLDVSSSNTTLNPRVMEKEMKNTLSDRPCYSRSNYKTSKCKATPKAELSNTDASATSALVTKSETKEAALQNAKQTLDDEFESPQRESVNDSLLEDLLSDCKRKRRDSLAAIYEENEDIEKHHQEIPTNMAEDSDLKGLRSNNSGHSKYHEKIANNVHSLTATSPSELFQTASGMCVSVSREFLGKARNTWNKTDQEIALTGADRLQFKDLESQNGFQTVPVGCVEKVQSSLSILKPARCITKKAEEGIENDGQSRGTSSLLTFSGFQTAGGKKVNLSDESLRQGREIMKRIGADSTEETSSFTARYHSTRQNDRVSKHTVQRRELKENGTEEVPSQKGRQEMPKMDSSLGLSEGKCPSNKTGLTSFSGFQTAAGKNVTLSKESLEKGAAIMQQIDKTLEQNNDANMSYSRNASTFSGFQTAGGQSVKLSEESLQKGAAIMQQIYKSLEQNKDTSMSHQKSKSGFSGFQTASGHSVKLSEESLQKGAAIIQQIDKSLDQNKDTSMSNTRSSSGFSGFQTASGQNVKLSKKSLQKGAAIMQQIDKSLEQNKDTSMSHQQSKSSFSGFQTASGHSVKLSEESLQKGAAIMQQIDKSLDQNRDNNLSHSHGTTGFTGFQTASGQSVKLSNESLQKGAAIMQQIDKSLDQNMDNNLSHSHNTSGFSGFQTASGQSVKLSKESLQKGATIMQQIDKTLDQNRDNNLSHSHGASGFSGFQTASGENVTLSKESLQKGATIMQQVDESLLENRDNNSSHSYGASGFSVFQAASGQSVKLSKESLQKGTAIMQRIDKSLQENKNNSTSHSSSATGFSGFQTASGQSVKLSKKSMEKGAAIMKQIDKSLQENQDSNASSTGLTTCKSEPSSTSLSSFPGFQTAGGRTVQISESALEKAKQTMAGIERELQTANLETTATSHDAAREARKEMEPMKHENDNSTTVITNGHQGEQFKDFFTAGGQGVSASEEAIDKAKTFLSDADKALNDSKTEETISSVEPTELHGRTMSTPNRSCPVDHDEAVSREVMESSEALLAYESIVDDAENWHDRSVGWSALDTPKGSVVEGQEKESTGSTFASNPEFPRRYTTPLRCSEDMFNSNHTQARNGMKPFTTTPTGVLHDRRARFHAPLRSRLTTSESSCSPRGADGNRSLRPVRTMTPGCFKSKSAPLPRTSTPLNSTANRRMSVPLPQFITPYRKQEAAREVSPLARCSRSSLPVSGSSVVQRAEVVGPSSKKPRISAPGNSMNTKSDHHRNASKAECKVKPQPGFLSQLRRHNQRIKLRDYVGQDTLPGQYTTAELIELGVTPEVLSVTSSNAESFRFVGSKYFSESVLCSEAGMRTEDGGVLHAGTDGRVGLEEIQRAFLSTPGVDSQLISEQWIANHYRWLVWKLAAMEVAFPRQFAGRCLTPDWILCQLKYRYDREIDISDRSALKKIMERDDISTRTMVLCVSSVTVTPNQTENPDAEQKDNDGEKDGQGSVTKIESSAIIEVTDGWYGIRAMLDRPLTRLLQDRKIVVGQKLFVYGAELIGSEQAVSPLEAPSSLMLRLHANSTRRARWDVKLGFHSHTHAFLLPLTSLFGDGGFTGCVDVIVSRQYPIQWMEKMPDGTNVFRNSRLEEREAKKFEADRHQRREKLFLKIQEEFEKEFQQPEKRRSARFRRRSFSSRDLSDLHDGKEIYEALIQASDPDAVKECLAERQIRALEDYRRLLQERKCTELQSKFERVWKEREEDERQLQRNVVPLLKVRITDYLCRDQAWHNAILSIWRPSEEVMHLLNEGSRLRIYHLSAAGVRNRQGASELQLSATRTTRYEQLPSDTDVKRMIYVPRQACSFDELRYSSNQLPSEVNVVGLVVFCSPLSSFSSPSSSVQTVYLSDEDCNVVAIKFWGGLKAVAVEDLVKPRTFICCSNLAVRPDDRLQCPSLTFSELSTLTLKPREAHLRTALNKLQQNIPDLNQFMCNIQHTLNTILRRGRVSPSDEVKVNTVRMYGQQNYASILETQSSDGMDVSDSSGKENNTSFNGQEHCLTGLAPSTSCTDHAVSHKPSVLILDERAGVTTPSAASVHMKSRQSKRKLLDSIAEPPPLSPLPSSIPASVRREFKRPRQVGRPADGQSEPAIFSKSVSV